MAELRPGLYELLITEGLRAQIDELAERLPVDERPLHSADAFDYVAPRPDSEPTQFAGYRVRSRTALTAIAGRVD